MEEFKIDKELRDLLPPLIGGEYKALENSILKRGYDNNFPIIVWNGYIADGYNRYEICRKHNIEFAYAVLDYATKEEVMIWKLDEQLGRRNLSPMKKILMENIRGTEAHSMQ